VELQYDASGRLDRYRDTDAGFTWRDQAYDGRGNVTSDGVHGFSYDRSGQPYAISGGASGSFVYDAHRRRVKQTLDGETIYSVYGLDGTLHYRDNITTGETTDYVRMGSHTVGRMDETDAFTWTHSDHLGSASATTDASGTILWRESYTPFGEVMEDPAANRDEAGFTGHIRDAATGLTYAQARYYNPVTARFLAPDPVGFASGGPGYFNRYAYTLNDAVNATDPDGELVNFLVQGAIGGAIGAAFETGRQLVNDGQITDPGAIGRSAAVGAVTGMTGGIGGAAVRCAVGLARGAPGAASVLSTTTGRAAQGAVMGPSGGAGGEVVAHAIDNGGDLTQTDLGAVGRSAGIGAIAGAGGGAVGAQVERRLQSAGF
jgi:RHS repeat-associated protein